MQIANNDNRTGSVFINAFASFMIPAFVLIAVYMLCGIAPFGGSLLLCDANADWFEALSRFHAALLGGDGIMYSFSGGLGGDFYRAFASGLCSPFWLISMAYTPASLAASVGIVMIFKAGFAGLFAYLMLLRLCDRTPAAALVFAIGYGAGSQFIMGFLAPQFTDAALLLPLVGVGISLLCERGSVPMLICAASLFLATSFQLWPCLLIFVAIYFAWFSMLRNSVSADSAPKNRVGMLILSLFISVGISSVVTVPALIAGARAGEAVYPIGAVDSASFGDILSGFFPGAVEASAVIPLAYCSTMMVMALPLYFFNHRIFLGERQLGLFFVIFLLLSTGIPALGWLWLGFSVPTGVTVGMGCVLCTMCIAMATRAITCATDARIGSVFISWLLAAVMFALAMLFGSTPAKSGVILFTAAFITLSAGILIIAVAKKGANTAFCVLAVMCILCECTFAGYFSLGGAKAAGSLDSASDN
ncbi:MAG: YfhO family protein [Clostridia bacterium]|nr:YfhO family protein [Clostridia bacterium]